MPMQESYMNDMPVIMGERRPNLSGSRTQIDLRIGGMDCPHCPSNVEEALDAIDGVSQARVNLANQSAHVVYDPSRVKILDLVKTIRTAGYSAGTALMRVGIKNMHCSS